VTDLYSRLLAAVQAHKALAEAALSSWPSIVGVVEGDPPFVAPDLVVEHIGANDPAFVIRACERDLKVLQRHAPPEQDDGPIRWTSCRAPNCRSNAPWPCDEIRELAPVYGIGVSDGR
jgi:hypothetical protein